MRTRLGLFALGLMLLAGPAGARPREFKEFEAPEELTEEELREQRAGGNSNVRGYDEPGSEPEKPFPWMALAFAGIVLLAAAPFALRYYFSVAAEVNSTRPKNEKNRTRRAASRTDSELS